MRISGEVMKTYQAKQGEVSRDWYLVDAGDKVLGRLAAEVSRKGAWCWYVEPGDLPSAPMPNMALPTPGRAAPGVPLPGGALPGAGLPGGALPAGGAPGAGASLPPMPNMTAAVVLDKPAIELHSSGPSAGQVTLLSRVRTPVTLILRDPKISGLGMKLDRTDLKNGERAVLSVESNGQAPPQAVIVTIVVKQTNQVIPVRITFAQAARK